MIKSQIIIVVGNKPQPYWKDRPLAHLLNYFVLDRKATIVLDNEFANAPIGKKAIVVAIGSVSVNDVTKEIVGLYGDPIVKMGLGNHREAYILGGIKRDSEGIKFVDPCLVIGGRKWRDTFCAIRAVIWGEWKDLFKTFVEYDWNTLPETSDAKWKSKYWNHEAQWPTNNFAKSLLSEITAEVRNKLEGMGSPIVINQNSSTPETGSGQSVGNQQDGLLTLTIDLKSASVTIGQKEVKLAAMEFSLYCMVAELGKSKQKSIFCLNKTFPLELLKRTLEIHKRAYPNMEGYRTKLTKILDANKSIGEKTWFEYVSKINSKIKKSGLDIQTINMFLITSGGPKGSTSYSIPAQSKYIKIIR